MARMLDMLKTISLKYLDERQNELKEQFIEMGQLKSDFDIEKFTIRKEGNFIAHNFHFLMRQYVFALSESKRMLLDKEELTRNLQNLQELEEDILPDGKYRDIEIARLENSIDMLEVNLANKLCMVEYMEKCRLKLIEMNGGKAPTNEQYQKEVPDYWEWFTKKQAFYEHLQANTGVRVGTWLLIDHLEQPPVLNENYQRILGGLNFEQISEDLKRERGYLHLEGGSD